jgi:hypothetical protein
MKVIVVKAYAKGRKEHKRKLEVLSVYPTEKK